MINFHSKKIMVLTGMMGSGKSTIGKNLALKLKRDFIDSDLEISKASALSINEIFDQFGEEYFRSGEKKIIKKFLLEKNKNLVLSIGGGAFIDKELRNLINNKSISIWLNASYDTLLKRLNKNTKNRPLFFGHELKVKLQELIDQRTKYYKLAHLEIDVNGLHVSGIIENIIKQLDRNYNKT